MAKTPEEIASLIEQLQATYAATSTSLVMLNDPDFHRLLQDKGYDAGSTMRLGRRDNTYYEGIRLWDSIHLAKENSQYNLNFLGSLFMTMVSWIGHELSENHYFDKTPELEFFRHLRNAISHGNNFHLKNGEPRRPAQFKEFIITSNLHGKPVLFEFMSTGDLFDLLDYTKVHLRSLILE